MSKDKALAESWINDPKDWRDMYRSKSYDYLKIVADGKSPVYSQSEGKYVAWVDMTDENAKAERDAANELREANIMNNNEAEEDLPF